MIWLTILRRFWWAIPMIVLLAFAFVYRIERNGARAEMIKLKSDLTSIRTVMQAQLVDARKAKEISDAQNASSTAAAQLLGADLGRRVRDYENRLRACSLRSAGQPVKSSRVDPVPEALAAAVAACARDAARLDNAVEWANSLKKPRP